MQYKEGTTIYRAVQLHVMENVGHNMVCDTTGFDAKQAVASRGGQRRL